ncbi:MAG: efflux RND transporter periplasmic adaptor subunit [Gammaproteobacteria bacterium]|nr:efflux RND transporter periplasmic adaptor subunit [Gammaproteobacteria bacterium]NNJ49012.1 efflux RND transporter periplasmic adaptor subunit [Gammaproteobacteria bacterium]
MIISKKHSLYRSLFAYFTICLLVSACDNNSDLNINTKKAQQAAHRVEVITVENKPVSLVHTVSGTLEAKTKIRLYNEESGRIIKLPYHEGDTVKKGTLLVQLDNELLKTEVAKATASKEQAQVDLSRLKKLLPKQISTEEEVARARTVLDLAIAEEKRQLTRLKRTSIKAPIDGLITKRLYEPGDLLAAQSHIHSIIDPSILRLEASLAERWIPLVSINQQVTLLIDALGDRAFKAKIVRIHPTINASTHKGLIEIQLDPVPAGAKVGQFARARVELKATDRLVIPVHSVQYDPQGAYVFRVVESDGGDTVSEKIYIEQGQQFGTLTEVLSALQTGDRIVSRGYLGLRNGKKVTVMNTAGDAEQTIEQDTVRP